jgi:hypothetical protein
MVEIWPGRVKFENSLPILRVEDMKRSLRFTWTRWDSRMRVGAGMSLRA